MSTSVYRRTIITITVIMASMMQLIDTSIVNVALPDIMGNVGADLSQAGWVITSYVFANVIIIPMTGWLFKFFGRKRYYLGSILVFVIASVLCGQAHTIWELILFRFIQGIGGGGLLPTSRVILVENFPPEDLGLANALFGMGVIIGPTIGPTLGGWLTTNYSWPWIFFVNIPVGIVAFTMALANVKNVEEQMGKVKTIDWQGILLLIVGFGSLQVVLQQGAQENWFDANYIILLTASAVIGVILFIWREWTAKDPVVDLKVLRHRNLAFGSIFGFILGFGLYASVFVFPIYLQNLLHYSAMQTGLVLLPGALTAGLMMPVVGLLLRKKFSARLLAGIGFFIFFIFTWKMSSLSLGSGIDDFYFPLILRGIGLGCLSVPLNTIALTGLKGHDLSEGSGFLSMTRQLGGSFGIALVSIFIDWRSALHRFNLVEHINQFSTATKQYVMSLTQGFMSTGSAESVATQQAYKTIDGIVTQQSMIMTYNDTFLVVGLFFLICIPLLLFLKIEKTKSFKPNFDKN